MKTLSLPIVLLIAASITTGWTSTARSQSDDGSAAVGVNHYTDLDFVILDDDERQLFVQIAGQLECPCVGFEGSLDQCLLETEQRCHFAVRVASRLMRRIKEDYTEQEMIEDLVLLMTPIQIDTTTAPCLGSPEASVQIVVFSDFECPFCRMFAGTLEAVHEEYGEQVAICFKHLPIDGHPNSLILARATMAAHNQGQFWPMHNLIFQNQLELREAPDISAAIVALAETLELDMDRFRADLPDDAQNTIPLRDREEGRSIGVRATPTCYINGIEFSEISDSERLHSHINHLLQEP